MRKVKTEIILGVTIDGFEIELPDNIDYKLLEDILFDAVWEVLDKNPIQTKVGKITEVSLDSTELEQ